MQPDPIEEILHSLRNNKRVRNAPFKANFVNGVAEMFRDKGYGATEIQLNLQSQRGGDVGVQARVILDEVFPLLRIPKIANDRRLGALIIKMLPTIKTMKEDKHDH